MEKLFIYDIETTGLIPQINGIHQISGFIVVDGEVKESLDLRVKPFSGDVIEKAALNVGGVTEEQILSYTSPREVHNNLISILSKYVSRYDRSDKFHLVGYNNASFDNQFLREFWKKNGDNYFGSLFWSDTIDVMCLASNFLRTERHMMPNFKLKTVAARLGVDVDEEKLHDAMYDINLTYQIFKLLNK